MSNEGSLVYNSRKTDRTSDLMFSLGIPRRWSMYREADCRLKRRKVAFKEADCELKDTAKEVVSSRMLKSKNNKYLSCTLTNSKKEYTVLDSIRQEESAIKADYECENKINSGIIRQIESEQKSLIFNALLAIVCSALYIMFFIITNGDYNTQISIVLTIALIAAVLNLAGTVILYMIDCDLRVTRRLGELLGVDPLYVQKMESDRRLLKLEAKLSKVKIKKRLKKSQ